MYLGDEKAAPMKVLFGPILDAFAECAARGYVECRTSAGLLVKVPFKLTITPDLKCFCLGNKLMEAAAEADEADAQRVAEAAADAGYDHTVFKWCGGTTCQIEPGQKITACAWGISLTCCGLCRVATADADRGDLDVCGFCTENDLTPCHHNKIVTADLFDMIKVDNEELSVELTAQSGGNAEWMLRTMPRTDNAAMAKDEAEKRGVYVEGASKADNIKAIGKFCTIKSGSMTGTPSEKVEKMSAAAVKKELDARGIRYVELGVFTWICHSPPLTRLSPQVHRPHPDRSRRPPPSTTRERGAAHARQRAGGHAGTGRKLLVQQPEDHHHVRPSHGDAGRGEAPVPALHRLDARRLRALEERHHEDVGRRWGGST